MVIDASAALEWVLQTPKGGQVEHRIQMRRGAGRRLFAPQLLDVEVAQVLRRHCARGLLSGVRAEAAFNDVLQMPVSRYPHEPLMLRVWELRQNLTAYDAVYVVLAEALDVPLLTCDPSIARAPGHDAEIELV